jgi:small subunit ribosomal protein S2
MDEEGIIMKTVSLEALLEAGCHFGHQVSRQNSKARDYIFEARDGIHIIDLEKTKEGLEDAAKFVKDIAKRGGTLLVVGTKRQAEALLREERKRLKGDDSIGLYFVTKRWIGGTLTNFAEVAKNYKKLKDTTSRLQNQREQQGYTKKEIGSWDKSRQKLESFYGGVSDMEKAPDAVFIIDTHHEHVAAGEAKSAHVPTVGITDTNADPTIIDFPIPSNDDAVGALKLVVGYVLDAWVEGKTAMKEAASNAVDGVKESEATSDVAVEKKEVKEKNEKVEKEEVKKAAPKKAAKPAAKKKTADK